MQDNDKPSDEQCMNEIFNPKCLCRGYDSEYRSVVLHDDYSLLTNKSLERDDPNSPWIRVCSIRIFPNFLACRVKSLVQQPVSPGDSKCPFRVRYAYLFCDLKVSHNAQSDKELIAQGDELPEERCMQQFYNPLCRCRGYDSEFNAFISPSLLHRNKIIIIKTPS